MHSEPTTNSGIPIDSLGALTAGDEPIVAGRLDWVTTVSREQLADLATRSRTLAGTARTRVTPLTELPSRRFRLSNQEQAQQMSPPPQPETGSSTPWMLIAIVASLVSVLMFIAARRSRQRTEDQVDIEVVMDSDTLPPERLSMQTEPGFDAVVNNP